MGRTKRQFSNMVCDKEMIKPTLRQKLTARMDQLQEWMESNYHLEHPHECNDLINNKLNFAWSVLSEEDRDYIHGAQYAIQEQVSWGPQ
jgi:hypothetical protein